VTLITLGINYWLHTRQRRSARPDSVQPFFLAQVKRATLSRSPRRARDPGVFRRSTHALRRPSATRSTPNPRVRRHGRLSDCSRRRSVVNAETVDTGGPGAEPAARVRPTILFLLLLFWFMRRSRARCSAVSGVRRHGSTHPRSRDHLRGRRRDRRGEAGTDGDRRLPADPEKYGRLADASHAASSSAARPHRQDAARARGWRAKPGRLLLHVRVRVRRGDRRVGASRVRDLFKQAKEARRRLSSSTKLDAIGRARAGGIVRGGATSDRR